MSKEFSIIAGPCSVESEEQVLLTAQKLSQTVKPDFFRAGVWKPRTRPGSFEGVGVKAYFGLKCKQNMEFLLLRSWIANHVKNFKTWVKCFGLEQELLQIVFCSRNS